MRRHSMCTMQPMWLRELLPIGYSASPMKGSSLTPLRFFGAMCHPVRRRALGLVAMGGDEILPAGAHARMAASHGNVCIGP
jgi:hypothetical protein